MPARIRVLDEITINQIAAGEVIENPSSVVKELVENSLDAGATEITVEVLAGGRHLIRITDNGVGMGQDDALLSLERHATSKLREIEDLSSLTSLGFRGEALPSIASISKFSLLTSEGKGGTLVRVEGGKLLSCQEAAREKGTTIEVKELFFNLPVRKKFLKSPAADETAIVRLFTELSLTRPDVKFQLILNQKPYLSLPPQEAGERIKAALGASFKEELLPVSGIELRGYIGAPHFARPNRSSQYLFLNGRPITSSFISWVIKEAYSTHLPPRRFPLFVLWLTLPPEKVDVNVHPQKREVRFRDEGALQDLIFRAVKQALFLKKEEVPVATSLKMHLPPLWQLPPSDLPEEKNLEITLPLPKTKPAAGRVIFTLKGYLLAEVPGEEGVHLIDQQRAHARILYEKLLKGEERPTEKEALLIPYTFELPKPEAKLLVDHLEDLRLIGFEIREFGADSFAIDAYPASYGRDSLENLITSFLEELKEFKMSRLQAGKLESRLAEKSSQLSLKGRKVLSFEEGQRLLEDLSQCNEPSSSPLGKPVRVHLNTETLAKYF